MKGRTRKVQSDLEINKLRRGGHDGGRGKRQIKGRFPERAWRDQDCRGELQRKCKYTEIKRSGEKKSTEQSIKEQVGSDRSEPLNRHIQSPQLDRHYGSSLNSVYIPSLRQTAPST